MRCEKCGFVFLSNGKKCPRCGNTLSRQIFYEKEINLFNWTTISVKMLIYFIIINLFLFYLISEIIINNVTNYNLKLSPWIFLSVFLFAYLFFNYFFDYKHSKKLNIKFVFLMFIFSLLWMVSYRDIENVSAFTNWEILFGFMIPTMVFIDIIFSIIYFIVFKKFDIFSIIFNGVILSIISLVSFGLSFVPNFAVGTNSFLRLYSLMLYSFNLIVLLNSFIVSGFKIRNRR